MNHPKAGIDPLLLDVETTLKNLVGHNSHHSFDIKKVLDIIREKGGTVGLKKYIGSIHCEIIIAALVILADNLPATDSIKYAVLAKLMQVLFTCIMMMLIDLIGFAEHRPKVHCGVKAMLSNLLGALGHP